MKKYTVEILSAARKQLKPIPKADKAAILDEIEHLADDPRPFGYIALKGTLKGTYRIRAGNYRVLYKIFDKLLVVSVVKIGDRKNVY